MVELYFGQRVGYRVSPPPAFLRNLCLKGGGGGVLTRYFTVLLLLLLLLKCLVVFIVQLFPTKHGEARLLLHQKVRLINLQQTVIGSCQHL